MKGVRDALTRLSGVKSVKVTLQTGVIAVETDPSQSVSPATMWREIERVGFQPVSMEIVKGGARYRVPSGGEDPPRLEK